MPRGEPASTGRLDWIGLLLVSTGIPLVVCGFTAWGEPGTLAATAVLASLTTGLTALLAFGMYARTAPNPVPDLRLFTNPAYTAASMTSAFTGAAMFGAGSIFPLYFQIGWGEGGEQVERLTKVPTGGGSPTPKPAARPERPGSRWTVDRRRWTTTEARSSWTGEVGHEEQLACPGASPHPEH